MARHINASPDGTKLLCTFTWVEGTKHSDIWISAIDGSGSQRFSTGKYGQGGSFSQGGASTFYCKHLCAPSSARSVDEGSPESRLVPYLEGGEAVVMPCSGSASYLYGHWRPGTVSLTPSLRRPLAASPDGQQLAVALGWADGATTQHDVWIAGLDGKTLERFSNGNYGDSAAWSPDGKYITLQTDAGAVFIPGIGTGYCRRWHAASTARNVDENSAGSRPLQYLVDGKAERFPCYSSLDYLQ